MTSAISRCAASLQTTVAVHDLSVSTREYSDQNGEQNGELTYRQLSAYSQSLARFLRERNVQPNDAVPLLACRGWEAIVGILAVLFCGAHYIPLGHAVSDDVLVHIVERFGRKAVLCVPTTGGRLRLWQHHIPALSKCFAVNINTGWLRDLEAEYRLKNRSPIDDATLQSICYNVYTGISLPPTPLWC